MKKIFTVLLLMVATLGFTQNKFSVDITTGVTFPEYSLQTLQPGFNIGSSVNYDLGKNYSLSLDLRYNTLNNGPDAKVTYINTTLGGEYAMKFANFDGDMLLDLGLGGYASNSDINNVTIDQSYQFGVYAGTGLKFNCTELIDLVGRVKIHQTFTPNNPFLTTELGLRFKI